MRRRDALFLAGLLGVTVAIPPILRHRARGLDFQDLPGQPPFRVLQRGRVSGGPQVFAGMRTPQEAAADAALPPQLCATVLGAEPWQPVLPVAFFTDHFCPYCAVLERQLIALRDGGAPIRLVFHQLPLLGARSRDLAKVVFAAGRQGASDAVHRDLMQRGLRPGPDALRALATRHGLDPARLRRDIDSAEVEREIEAALALGRALGLPGTPGTVIGRTIVIGAIDDEDLQRLIELERTGPLSVCP